MEKNSDIEIINCKNCKKDLNKDIFISNLNVCPECNFHDYIDARRRIESVVDSASFVEFSEEISSYDFLNFYDLKSYEERLYEARLKTGLNEAIVTGNAKIGGFNITLAVLDFGFLGGSMGSVVGEKIKRAVENSIKKNIPLIIFSASGGARMQEGIISLMQMAKTVSSINRLKENFIPYFCIITNPTTGGVSASFVTIADIIISEPGALFCFAGPRVVEQTIKKKIPLDFGLAERNLKNGQIDLIVQRKDLKLTLTNLLDLFLNRDF